MSDVTDLGDHRDLKSLTRGIDALVAQMRRNHLDSSPDERERVVLLQLVEARDRYAGMLKIAREPFLQMLVLALAAQATTLRPLDLCDALRLVLGEGSSPDALASAVRAVLEALPSEQARIEKQYGSEETKT